MFRWFVLHFTEEWCYPYYRLHSFFPLIYTSCWMYFASVLCHVFLPIFILDWCQYKWLWLGFHLCSNTSPASRIQRSCRVIWSNIIHYYYGKTTDVLNLWSKMLNMVGTGQAWNKDSLSQNTWQDECETEDNMGYIEKRHFERTKIYPFKFPMCEITGLRCPLLCLWL